MASPPVPGERGPTSSPIHYRPSSPAFSHAVLGVVPARNNHHDNDHPFLSSSKLRPPSRSKGESSLFHPPTTSPTTTTTTTGGGASSPWAGATSPHHHPGAAAASALGDGGAEKRGDTAEDGSELGGGGDGGSLVGVWSQFSLDTIYHRGQTLLWDLLQDDQVGELGEALAVQVTTPSRSEFIDSDIGKKF